MSEYGWREPICGACEDAGCLDCSEIGPATLEDLDALDAEIFAAGENSTMDEPKPVDLGTPMVPRRDCKHEHFKSQSNVIRMEDKGLFMLELSIGCTQCGTRFQFMGLEPGIDLHGARVCLDALEARLAICPEGAQPNPLDRIAIAIGHPKGLS